MGISDNMYLCTAQNKRFRKTSFLTTNSLIPHLVTIISLLIFSRSGLGDAGMFSNLLRTLNKGT